MIELEMAQHGHDLSRNKLPMQWESPPLRTVGSSKDQ